MSIKTQTQSDMKDAMRAGDKARLSVIRMLLAAVQRREVDERTELDDAGVLKTIEKLVKQGQDSARQYTDGGRQELAEKELAEIAVLREYLPEPLGDAGFTITEATRMISDGLARLASPAPFADSFVTLIVVGVFLSMVRERTGNILWAIGIHAGWITIIKLYKYLTDTTLVDGMASPWIGTGYDDITGWMATLWLAAIAAVYWYRSRPARWISPK